MRHLLAVAYSDAVDRSFGAAHVRRAGPAVPVRLLHDVRAAGGVALLAAVQGSLAGRAAAVAAQPGLADLKQPAAAITLRAAGASYLAEHTGPH